MVNTEPQIEIRLFGQPVLRCRGTHSDAFRSLRLQRLVGALALESDGMPKSRLAFQLWPESTDAQARTNLRKALHELRNAVPDLDACLDADHQRVALRGGVACQVDVITFESAIRSGDDVAAAAAYTGRFLPDCYDDWVIAAAERLQRAAGGALDRLADGAAERGDHAAVIGYASARLRLDPCWEPAYRHLVRAHSGVGNRAEALQSYHRCAEVLRDELDVDPDPATKLVYDEVRRVVGEVPHPTPVSSASMIGRDAEFARALATWQETLDGASRLLLVTGEAGIGKSRLVTELARAAQGRATVARSRAYEAAGRLPWGPVIEWLRADLIAGARQGLNAVWRQELSVLLPEAHEGAVFVHPGGTAGRARLFDAISHGLLAGDRPVLLVVDDLQWCDVDTIDLIGYLTSTRHDSPVLIAGTVRMDEVAHDHPLTRMLTSLWREGSVSQLDLEPLDTTAVVELVGSLTGSQIETERAEALRHETGGNPLFVVETARGWASRGSGPILTPLTSTIRATISSRLTGLSAAARALVELAAAHRREFSSDLLIAASDLDPPVVLDALDELWQRHIVRDRGAAYDFTHDKVREVVYDAISPVRRRRLHSALATALIKAHGEGPGPHSALLAAQLDAAGNVPDAVDAHLNAAQYAVSVFGLDEAIASCRRGLELLERLSPGPDRDERELEIRLALASQVVARDGYASALGQDLYGRTLSLCRHLGRAVDPATLRGLGLAAVTSCQFDRAQHFGRELLTLEHDPLAVTEGHYLSGVTAFWRGRLDESEHHLRAAIDSYRPDLGPVHRLYYAQDPMAVCLVRLAITRLWRGDLDEARRLADEARSFAMSLGHPMTLGYVLLYTTMAAIELDDDAWLRREVEQAAGIDDHPLGFVTTVQRIYRAYLGIREGHDALDDLAAAVDTCRLESTSLHLTHGLSILARAHLRLGSFDAGLAVVREGLDWSATHDQRYSDPLMHRVEAKLLRARGDHATADAALARCVETASELGADRFLGVALDRRT